MAIAVVVFILISCFSFAFGQTCVCGVEGRATRIIGGTQVSQGKYPWMAFLLINRTMGPIRCGGAIINDLYILTVSHCLEDAIDVKVGVGSIYDDSRNVMLPTASFTQHPDFDIDAPFNDIGLVKLETPLRWSKRIRPICLPTADMDASGNLTVAGWGVKEMQTGNFSRTLLATTVEEYNFDDCNDSWTPKLETSLNSDSQFCAALLGQDSCLGDSGGPLWKRSNGRSYAVGIVSFGEHECGSILTSVYTKVSHFLDWIQQNTADANYCSN